MSVNACRTSGSAGGMSVENCRMSVDCCRTSCKGCRMSCNGLPGAPARRHVRRFGRERMGTLRLVVEGLNHRLRAFGWRWLRPLVAVPQRDRFRSTRYKLAAMISGS